MGVSPCLSKRVVSRRTQDEPEHREARTDAALVAAARSGDDAAFAALVTRHVRAALAVARAVVGDADVAEDVCQEALFCVWQQLDDCREPDRFAVWLAVAVRRHALNALRRQRTTFELSHDLVSELPGPERNAEAEDEFRALDAAMQKLSSEQRQVVLLFDLEGWSHAEIAASLDTTEAMSRQHLMLGRRRLRQLLSDRENPR
jgi:RNA polymerase sigma-70 factor (ECF subfamily)